MKKLLAIVCLTIPRLLFGQVGVATNEPTAELDVNGSLRIQQIPIGETTNELFVVDEQGYVFSSDVKNAQFNKANNTTMKTGDITVVDENADVLNERFIPTLDLWTQQEMNGEEGIKNVYFVSLSQRITMPQNITTLGDNKIRKLTFILIQNNAPEGFDTDTYSQGFDQWRIYFQTKKFEMQSDGADCYVNDQTFIYQPAYSDLFVPDPANYYNTDGTNSGERSRLKGYYQDQIRDREFVFYDFGGKWILSSRD